MAARKRLGFALGQGVWIAWLLAGGSLAQTYNGLAAGERAGTAVAALGDVNGDGVPDLAVGAPAALSDAGRVRVYSGATGSVLWSVSGTAGERMGEALARIPDVTGDGRDELLIGGPGYGGDDGCFRLLSGSNGATLASVFPGSGTGRFGAAVASAGDVDGDGDEDFLVGAPNASSAAGRVELWSVNGGLMRTHSSPWATGRFGNALAAARDVTGDGRPDYAIGAPGADTSGFTNNGAMRLYSGATGAALDSDAGAGDFDGLGTSLSFAIGVAANPMTGAPANPSAIVLLAGAPEIGGLGTGLIVVGAGGGYVRRYLASGTGLAQMDTLSGGATGNRFGSSVASAGDLDDDGTEEHLVGATQLGILLGQTVGPGFVKLYQSNSFFAFEPGVAWFGGTFNGDGFGASLAMLGDIDGDAIPDLLAGAPGSDVGGTDSGRAVAHHPVLFPSAALLITEVSTGEPDGVEISWLKNASSINLAGWTVRWDDGTTKVSSPLSGTLQQGQSLLVTEASPAPIPEKPASVPVLAALPVLGTSSGDLTVALVSPRGLVVDEVRIANTAGTHDEGSQGGKFRGLALRPPGSSGSVNASRLWRLDSNSGSDWVCGGARSFGLLNAGGGTRGTDPLPIDTALINEVDTEGGYVELKNTSSAFVDFGAWRLRVSPRQGAAEWEALGVPSASGDAPVQLYPALPGGFVVVCRIFAPDPAETPSNVPTVHYGAWTLYSGEEAAIGLYDPYGRAVDLVRITRASSLAVHNHPHQACAPDDFRGAALRYAGDVNAVIGRNSVTDTNSGADWKTLAARTMGLANPSSGIGGGVGSALDVRLSEAGDNNVVTGNGLTLILDGGAANAGRKWSILVSFQPTMGTGPLLGLGWDAFANWLALNAGPPFAGLLDATGSARLDIVEGGLPPGLHTENVFLLQDAATGAVLTVTPVLFLDT